MPTTSTPKSGNAGDDGVDDNKGIDSSAESKPIIVQEQLMEIQDPNGYAAKGYNPSSTPSKPSKQQPTQHQ